MRILLIFSCLISIAFTATLPGGYNYNQPLGIQHQQQAQHHFTNQQNNKPTIYSKQFFIHSAPEENESAENFLPKNSAAIKKNLRVLLIKSPENSGLADATLALAKSESESHTVVYVLNKQTDVAELQDKLEKLNEVDPNKPVVYFIKYRTPQEADLATTSIQSKYDSLSGTSQVTDEGVAPVLSFIGSGSAGPSGNSGGSIGASGSLDTSNQQQQFAGFSNQLGASSSANTVASPSITNSYLPANLQ